MMCLKLIPKDWGQEGRGKGGGGVEEDTLVPCAKIMVIECLLINCHTIRMYYIYKIKLSIHRRC